MRVVKYMVATRTTPEPASTLPSHRPAEHEPGTREQLAELIGREGPITVADLAARLDLTAPAIRRHLDVMLADGLVEARELTGQRRRGRPAKAYVLSAPAHQVMATGYDELAAQLLAHLAAEGGRTAVEAFARARSSELASRLRPVVEAAGEDPQARVRALAAALQQEGFAATARPVAVGTPAEAAQLCQGHCPVQSVAAQYPELCDAETAAFADLVGTDVRRLATLAQGDHVCTTHVPLGPPELRRRPHPTGTTTALDPQGGRND